MRFVSISQDTFVRYSHLVQQGGFNGQYTDVCLGAATAVFMMKGISVVAAGGPERLKYGDVNMPELTEGQVLIKVYATALNGADLLQRAGNYPCPPGSVKNADDSWHVRQKFCVTGRA